MFNFFKTFIQALAKSVRPLVKTVQTWIQSVARNSGMPQQSTYTPAAPAPAPMQQQTPEEREHLRRQQVEAARQRKLARMEADFEKDIARKEAGNEQPLKYPVGYLSKQADTGIQWLGDKEAQKVIQMMRDTPVLVTATLSVASSPKAVFDLLLAQGIDLSSEVLLQIIASRKDSIGDQYVGLTSDSPVYQGNDDIPWWEHGLGTVVVSYQLSPGESLQSIAIRMNVPEDVLLKMNNGLDTTSRNINIPLPGWVQTQIGNEVSDSIWEHMSGRTLAPTPITISKYFLGAWWESLTVTEQHIEMALAATASPSARENAPFDNVTSFDKAATWIEDWGPSIELASENFGVDPVLLKTVLMSELLYDYGIDSRYQDASFTELYGVGDFAVRVVGDLLGREEFRDSWSGAGVGNTHYQTLIEAYQYLTPPEKSIIHPWDSTIYSYPESPNAPDLSNAPIPEGANFWEQGQNLDQVPFELRMEIGAYTATPQGSIRSAAMITRMLVDRYVQDNQDEYIDVNNLTAESMAIIWSAYRSSEGFQFKNNAQLALPVAEYLLGEETK